MTQINPPLPTSSFVLGTVPHNNFRAGGTHQPLYSKQDRDPSKMSNYETNPVGALQERFQSRGITPQYRVVQAEGASHAPTFSFQVGRSSITSSY